MEKVKLVFIVLVSDQWHNTTGISEILVQIRFLK